MGLEIATYISTQTDSESDYIEKMIQVYQSLQVDRYVSDTNFCPETHVTDLNFITFEVTVCIWITNIMNGNSGKKYADLKE